MIRIQVVQEYRSINSIRRLSLQLKLQFIAMDSNGAVSAMIPTMYLCACHHGGRCVKPSKITGADSGEKKFLAMSCSCPDGYTGRYCESDIDACEANLNPCYPGVECIDLPAPANMTSGYKCAACPLGYSGNGASCTGKHTHICQRK